MISGLREKMEKINLFLAKPFAVLGIHPNIVSFTAIPLALFAGYFIVEKNFLLALVFAIAAVSIDLIDGSVAKLLKKTSNFGNYFETMIDKFVEVLLFIPFALFFPLATALAISFSLITSYAKPRAALVIIADNRDWPAIGEHAERMLLLIFGIFLSVFNLRLFHFEAMELILYLIALMTLVGSIQRIHYAKKLIEEAEKKGKILPYLKKGVGHKAVE